ncbi:hypothetical protein ACFFIX_05130 [Metabacillus herbersteinensis]|uniref:Uncharacterized protein n=1 Tax=Metabacillus herbersteinensis TaxID=283816 RepID=A0ABV6GAX1_9BACI
MEQNPIHYDGSVQITNDSTSESKAPFQITEEVRKNISGNPYINEY